MSEATIIPGDPIEAAYLDALKKWPLPWHRHNGRIVAINGATVGHFAPKIPIAASAEVAPGINAGVTTIEAISDTISTLVGLGEVMERGMRSEFAHRREIRAKDKEIAELREKLGMSGISGAALASAKTA